MKFLNLCPSFSAFVHLCSSKKIMNQKNHKTKTLPLVDKYILNLLRASTKEEGNSLFSEQKKKQMHCNKKKI